MTTLKLLQAKRPLRLAACAPVPLEMEPLSPTGVAPALPLAFRPTLHVHEGTSALATPRPAGRRKQRGKSGQTQNPKPRGAANSPKRTPLQFGKTYGVSSRKGKNIVRRF
jgi:hypothetical protein